MNTSAMTREITLTVLFSVGSVAFSLYAGYIAYLCVRDPDRIRNFYARFYLGTQFSDAFIQRRLFSGSLGASILSAASVVTALLGLFDVPLWRLPLLVGAFISLIIVLTSFGERQ